MRFNRVTKLPAALALLCAGCGGGSTGGRSGGDVSFRAVWEQRGVSGSALNAAPGPGGQLARGSFGPQLPHAVRTIRIVIDSATGQRCCVAVDPSNVSIDPISGGAFLVLDSLPAGPATIALAGFANEFAPAPAGVTAACATEPANGTEPCDATRPATPSYRSDPQFVTIVANVETDAGDIPVYAVPFLYSSAPAPDSTTASPVSFAYTIVDAVTGVNSQSVSLTLGQGDQTPANVPLTLSACDDASANPCTPCGQLGVAGVLVTAAPQAVGNGTADARVQATNLASPPRSLDFDYPFQVNGQGQLAVAADTVVVVEPPASIAEAAKQAPPGATIVVAPGVYAPVSLAAGDLQGPVTFLADASGTLTNSPAAAVVINGGGQSPAFVLSDQTNVIIDGFTLRAATNAALLVTGGNGIVLRNSTISGGLGDGVRFESSTNGLVFDNLIYNNSGTGIRMSAVTSARVINNTVYNSGNGGLAASDSCNVVVQNNIFNENRPLGIVETSTGEYSADFNLNTDGYGASTPVGAHDSGRDPLFIAPSRGDFHLPRGLAGSTSPAIDTGNPATEPDLASMLESRSTQTDGTLDTRPVDLGYHYPVPTPGS